MPTLTKNVTSTARLVRVDISPSAQESKGGLFIRRVVGTPATITINFDDVHGDSTNVKANVIRLLTVQFARTGAIDETRLTITQTTGFAAAQQIRFQAAGFESFRTLNTEKLPLFRENGPCVCAVASGGAEAELVLYGEYA